MTSIRTETLAGVPIHYDRFTREAYGTPGTKIKPYIDKDFFGECETCFTELKGLLEPQFGTLEVIVTGGISRAGSGSSYHHANRAFDLDALFFQNASWVANTFPERPHFYLAIESILRRHFGTILNYDYNQKHEDHFHFDNGTSPGFSSMSKSRVIYLQNSLVFNFDIQVGRDGVYGPETAQATRQVRETLGVGGFSTTTNWLAFLSASAAEALARAE